MIESVSLVRDDSVFDSNAGLTFVWYSLNRFRRLAMSQSVGSSLANPSSSIVLRNPTTFTFGKRQRTYAIVGADTLVSRADLHVRVSKEVQTLMADVISGKLISETAKQRSTVSFCSTRELVKDQLH